MIPLPPLDGGHFLPYFLPPGAGTLLHSLEQFGPMILLLLVVSGATQYIVGPVFEILTTAYIALVRLFL
jgi:Zn-dependent protease